ncbi:hypothetical protein C7408_101248 [Paraburkholderia caballeronis]|nr:hypothetical protein C7408_101248 [Paraburkholderia caballeronis]TDV21166.1 hypothetical protein C7406_10259 [Paraburkholderia caballeronis]TDV33204.1 hypothetical protein C7404_101344 [Paraburkholderia caballeronis]
MYPKDLRPRRAATRAAKGVTTPARRAGKRRSKQAFARRAGTPEAGGRSMRAAPRNRRRTTDARAKLRSRRSRNLSRNPGLNLSLKHNRAASVRTTKETNVARHATTLARNRLLRA